MTISFIEIANRASKDPNFPLIKFKEVTLTPEMHKEYLRKHAIAEKCYTDTGMRAEYRRLNAEEAEKRKGQKKPQINFEKIRANYENTINTK